MDEGEGEGEGEGEVLRSRSRSRFRSRLFRVNGRERERKRERERVVLTLTLSRSVLRITHFLQPLHRFSINRFLNRDVSHGGGGRGAVPVFLTRLEADHIARTDLFDRSALALRQAAARRDDEDLAEWMSVPCRARTRLKRDRVARRPR